NDAWPIFTAWKTAPPAKVVAVAQHGPGQIADSLLSNGVIISGGYVRSCVLSPNVRVEPGAVLENCILFDNVKVGAGAVLRKTIIDKNVSIPPGYRIGVDSEQDRARFEVSPSGVVAIAKGDVVG
ncbi:MAG: glucose-1-phosphate adenylyltransferase, partial [Acidimicrobiia bacterium]